MMTLAETNNKVLIEGHLSEQLKTRRGLRQGYPLLTDLFNLILEIIMRESKIQTKGLIFHLKEQGIALHKQILGIPSKNKESIRKNIPRRNSYKKQENM